MTALGFWEQRNLRENPFFQEALEPGTRRQSARYPIDLFVGRTEEAERIVKTIELSRPGSSRNAVQGAPGIGKTTLVQYIKEQVAHFHIGSIGGWVSVGRTADPEKILLQILDQVYRIVIEYGDETTRTLEPVQTTRQLLLAYQTRAVGFSIGLPGGPSGGISTSLQHHTDPGALLVQGPTLLRQLATLALDHLGLQGILIHLNNLENMIDAEAERAAAVLRELRDPCLMIPGLHYILVGTDDAIRTVISGVPQLRSVFGVPEIIPPLAPEEVDQLLGKRYEYLRVDHNAPVPPLVTRESLYELYQIFRGDLRGTFQALEEAAKRIAMLGEDPADPMDPGALRQVLRTVYQQMLTAQLTMDQLAATATLCKTFPDQPFTQAAAQKLWKLARTQTSVITNALLQQGIIVAAGFSNRGPGRPAQLYRLAGSALIAFS